MNVTAIGIYLAKSVFQLHGVDAAGEVVFRKKIRRRPYWVFCVMFRPAWMDWKPVRRRTSGPARSARWAMMCGLSRPPM